MTLIAGCKHSLDVTIPLDEVETETGRVVASLQKRVKMPGFRPGKVPPGMIRRHFEQDIRQQVLENLVPVHLQKAAEQEDLKPVGSPEVKNLKFEPGQPVEFTAEFEVSPEFELGEYEGVTVVYQDPEVTDADIDARIEQIRERKVEYVNVDPRPLETGDVALIKLTSVSGVEGPPVEQDDLMLELGAADTFPAFTENLMGMSPDESKEFEVSYPEDYGQPRLAGKTVKFSAEVKGVRKKELPEVNDEFAQDLGDFRTLEELKEEIRKSIYAERQAAAQDEAKSKIVESLVDAHEFPVPDAYVDQQIRSRLEQTLRSMAAEGMDISNFKPDWEKLRESQAEKATREVKASLLLSRIAERESINAMKDEVDREVERFARQSREPVPAVRVRLEKDGTINRIASHLVTQKTLNFLFERARKTAE